MSGTTRTLSYLLNLFRPGQSPGSLTAQDVEDFIASIYANTSIYNVKTQGGCHCDGTTDDTSLLATALSYAINNRLTAYVPGSCAVTGTVNAVASSNSGLALKMLGVQGVNTIVCNTYVGNILVVGDGTNTLAGSELTCVSVQGPGRPALQTGNVSILLNGALFTRVIRCQASGTDIGMDMINNCFGSSFYDCIANGSGCNVAMNLRSTPTTGCGNTISFFNNWFAGYYAGMQISPNVDGITVFGGQITNAFNTSGSFDAYGSVIIGKDYLTGTTGGDGDINFYSVDFEAGVAWIFRLYFATVKLTVTGSSFFSDGGIGSNIPTIGVMKVTGGGTGSFVFINNSLYGGFSSSTALSVADYGGSTFIEIGTSMNNGDTPLFGYVVGTGGTAPTTQSMLAQSGMTHGIYMGDDLPNSGQVSSNIWLAGLRLRNSSGVLQTSPDNSTWTSLSTSATAALPNTISGLQLWLTADQIVGVADAGSVSSWVDSSGLGNTAVQATGGNQPAYASSRASIALPRNCPVVRFNGTTDLMTSPVSVTTAQTIFIVASTVATTTQSLFGSSGGGGLELQRHGSGTACDTWAYIDGTYQANSFPNDPNGIHVWAMSYADTGAWAVYEDNYGAILTGTSATAIPSSQTLVIGHGSGGYWNGWIGEVIFYNAVLTVAQINSVLQYLMEKYGIAY